MFKILTSETKDFTNCFQNNNLSALKQVENWRRVLKTYCSKALGKLEFRRKLILSH